MARGIVKIILCMVLFAMCATRLIDAAAAATHVYFAQEWISLHRMDDPEDQKVFIAGTLFPDIRYLGTISRSRTHEKGMTARVIRATESLFLRGMRLHVFVDVTREKFVASTGILHKLKDIPKEKRVLFLKLLEDEILWERVWRGKAQESLQEVYPEEIEEMVTLETASEWHEILTGYLSKKPSEYLFERAQLGHGFLNVEASSAELWSQLLKKYATEPAFLQHVDEMIQYLKSKMW